MINLTTFQTKILKFYILPIIFFGLIVSYNITYSLSKNFIDNITFKQQTKEIKEIKRKGIELNGVELKKWTLLTDTQKDYFVENESEKLQDTEKFKVRYKTEYKDELLTDENINENYNLILFLQVLILNFKFGIILLFLIPASFIYLFYKKYYLTKLKPLENFFNLSYYNNELKSENNLQNNNEFNKIKKLDEFLKYDEKENKYLFKTYSINQKDIWEKNKENIEKFLKMESIKIEQEKLIIKISEKSIPNFLPFNENDYKNNFLFLGQGENGKKIHLDLFGIKHSIIIGESGSGKSVFVQNFLLSVFKNIDEYEKVYLIDFKMVEMLRYTNLNKKINVVSQIQEFVKLIEEIEKIMFERYEEMRDLNLNDYVGQSILIFIDEFRTIQNNNLDKKIKEKMIDIMINLLQKSRAAKIFLIFSGQKRDTKNLDSSIYSNIITKICLRTSNQDNLIKIRGTQEELKLLDLSHQQIQKFNRGKLLYRDGDSGENFLLQSPFFNVSDDKHNYFMLNLLGLNDEEIEMKIKRIKFINEKINDLKMKKINKETFKSLIKKYDLDNKKENDNDLINLESDDDNEKEIEILEELENEKENDNDFLEFQKSENEILEELESERKEKWKETYNLENKNEQSLKRKELIIIKKLIDKKEIEERKTKLLNY